MKIVQFTQPGPPEVLKYIDAPVPEPSIRTGVRTMSAAVMDLLPKK